jgi:hypothetical protein
LWYKYGSPRISEKSQENFYEIFSLTCLALGNSIRLAYSSSNDNSLRFSSMDPSSINRLFFVFNILTVDLIWGIFDGWMLVFTNLLTEGRYNKMIITRVKSSDKNLASEIIKMELDNTIIGRCDEETKRQIVEMVLKSLSSISQDALEKPRILKDHFIAALICIFFVFLPSIVISPFFLLISDLNPAILVSNIIGLSGLFALGYKN